MSERPAIGVGSKVWFYDVNHREYTTPKDGRIWGEIIERAHWRPVAITAETSRSWVTARGQKIHKSNESSRVFLRSEQEIDDWAWSRANAHKIANLVSQSKDADVLRKIAAIVGYVAP